MLLNIYTALESQAGSQLWTVPTEGFLSNFSDYVGGCDAWLVVKKYIGFLFFLQKNGIIWVPGGFYTFWATSLCLVL